MLSAYLQQFTSTSKLPFLVLVTVFGVALVEITFSMRKGENLAWQTSPRERLLPYLPTPPLRQDLTQCQFLSGVSEVSIQSFPSPRLVASPRLNNPVCPTIYP